MKKDILPKDFLFFFLKTRLLQKYFSILTYPVTRYGGRPNWGGGVSHFDGQQWYNLTTADGLAGNIVYSIAQDKNNVLWFGTNNGLSRYDGATWTTYNQATGLLENNVYAILALPSGEIWAGTKRGVSRLGLQ